jgi:hypothetical protein
LRHGVKNLNISEDDQKIMDFQRYFSAHEMDKRVTLANDVSAKFVHYTDADSFLSILKNKNFWMRKTQCMNDFGEFHYGMSIVKGVMDNGMEEKLRITSDAIWPNAFDDALRKTNSIIPNIERDTYISCMSEHYPQENTTGRLSMWRGYSSGGGIAIVFNKEAFEGFGNGNGIYSTPIKYFDKNKVHAELLYLNDSLIVNRKNILNYPRDSYFNALVHFFKMNLIGIKHPGFKEEKEWRIFYTPSVEASPRIKIDIHVVGGVLQQVAKIPLTSERFDEMPGTSINELINAIIIGPNNFPLATKEAVIQALSEAGVKDARDKVVLSEIPLRT